LLADVKDNSRALGEGSECCRGTQDPQKIGTRVRLYSTFSNDCYEASKETLSSFISYEARHLSKLCNNFLRFTSVIVNIITKKVPIYGADATVKTLQGNYPQSQWKYVSNTKRWHYMLLNETPLNVCRFPSLQYTTYKSVYDLEGMRVS